MKGDKRTNKLSNLLRFTKGGPFYHAFLKAGGARSTTTVLEGCPSYFQVATPIFGKVDRLGLLSLCPGLALGS